MGGYGSGRWGSRKPTAESMKRLDLARLRREGSLNPGTASALNWSCWGEKTGRIGTFASADGLRLTYRTQAGDGLWRNIDETVRFDWTDAPFGGLRQWFRCPGCNRRCRVLFGGIRFRCRRCQGLRYGSQAETHADRANRGMFKIVRRLDPDAECNDLPFKPKGMHWRTYERLAQCYEKYNNQWAVEVMRRFGIRP